MRSAVLNKSLGIPYNQSMAGNANCLGGIGHFRMKNIFPIFTQPLACGDRKEDGRDCSRFLQLRRYSQVVEKLASQARRSPEAEKNMGS